MEIGIMTSGWDTWISEEELQELDADDIGWFKEEIGLTREDLVRLLARAKEFVQSNDDILNLTYDTDGAWYISFRRNDADGHWEAYVRRKDDILA